MVHRSAIPCANYTVHEKLSTLRCCLASRAKLTFHDGADVLSSFALWPCRFGVQGLGEPKLVWRGGLAADRLFSKV